MKNYTVKSFSHSVCQSVILVSQSVSQSVKLVNRQNRSLVNNHPHLSVSDKQHGELSRCWPSMPLPSGRGPKCPSWQKYTDTQRKRECSPTYFAPDLTGVSRHCSLADRRQRSGSVQSGVTPSLAEYARGPMPAWGRGLITSETIVDAQFIGLLSAYACSSPFSLFHIPPVGGRRIL